jgi:hypothetical protein
METSTLENGKTARWMEKVRSEVSVGTYYYANGDKYEGEWVAGKGKGTLHYANGDKYDGELKNNKKNGKGKLIEIMVGTMNYANGDKCECNWVDDKKEGPGTI